MLSESDIIGEGEVKGLLPDLAKVLAELFLRNLWKDRVDLRS